MVPGTRRSRRWPQHGIWNQTLAAARGRLDHLTRRHIVGGHGALNCLPVDRLRRVRADRRRCLDPVTAPQLLESLDLLAGEQVLATEQSGHQADLGEMLDRLHLEVGGKKVRADGQRPVVGEQHPVVRGNVLTHGFGQLRR